jgi:hypothetical protein
VALGLAVACRGDRGSGAPAPSPSASAGPGGLSPELAAQVLAKVGDQTITLGDYTAVLDRMDRFDRLRYQTPDRKKQLLDEIIDTALFAREAERRGLAGKPETKELVRQLLREELIRELAARQPKIEDIPAAEVRAFYDAHHDEFREPERRRITHVALKDRATAEQVLAEARSATAKQWGELVQKYSIDKPATETPVELAGDLGFVTSPATGPNDNLQVPEAVRSAAFEIDAVGGVFERPIEASLQGNVEGSRFYVVRLTAKNPPRGRSLEEADRAIRVRLVQERLHKAEEDFERELRSKIPVRIDEAALAKVSVPNVGKKP